VTLSSEVAVASVGAIIFQGEDTGAEINALVQTCRGRNQADGPDPGKENRDRQGVQGRVFKGLTDRQQ
jgi:hypothetical protein